MKTDSPARWLGALVLVVMLMSFASVGAQPPIPHSNSQREPSPLAKVQGPQQLYSVEPVSQFDTPGTAHAVAVAGQYVYVAADTSGLRIINISDPANPSEVGFYATAHAYELQVAGNYAYVSDVGWWYNNEYVDSSLTIVDITAPDTPVEVGTYETSGRPSGLVLSGPYVYLANGCVAGYEGLRIVDVSTPQAPAEVGFYDTPGCAIDVAVVGDHAYVTGQTEGLSIVDISNPASLSMIGWHDTPNLAWGVAAQEGLVYVAEAGYAYPETWGLRIFDVSDPETPAETGFHNTPRSAEDVSIVGDYAFVAASSSGLRIIDVSDPETPTEVGFYDTPGTAWDVAVANNYAYVADGDNGLVILRPLQDRVTGMISPSGGILSSTSGDASFAFPSGAFTDVITLTYRHLWSDQETGSLGGIDRTFELTAVYSDTGQPAQVAPGQTFTATLTYSDTQIGSILEETLALYWWNGSQWVKESTSTTDTETNTVSATPNHLSLCAVLGERRRIYVPLILRMP